MKGSVKTIFASRIGDDLIAPYEGEFLSDDWISTLVGDPGFAPVDRLRIFDGPDEDWEPGCVEYVEGPVRVNKPGGEPLLIYVPDAIPAKVCADAWAVLRTLRDPITNRGAASGVRAKYPVRSDGRRSKTNEVRHQDPENVRIRGVHSSIIGNMERVSARFPMCRKTAFNLRHPERFAAALPYIQHTDRVFAAHLPARHEAQMTRLRATHPAWTISGTSYTTVTVNKSFRTALHKDRGDLPEGFGVMAVLRAGEFSGCYTMFPAFGVAVDMRTRGVLLADVHEWHCNSVLVGQPGEFERVATVMYYRKNMTKCGSPEDEREYAANRKSGDPLWPDHGPGGENS